MKISIFLLSHITLTDRTTDAFIPSEFMTKPSASLPFLCLFIFVVFSLVSSLVPRIRILKARATSSPTSNCSVCLELAPLIKGPSWLPLHVKVILQEQVEYATVEHTFDYVPRYPTKISTLLSLLRLESVPGEVRSYSSETTDASAERSNPSDSTDSELSVLLERANLFCESFSPDLNLVSNSCWTFAVQLRSCLLDTNTMI